MHWETTILDKVGKKQITKRVRIGIQGTAEERNSLLVIENKFKSFPYKEQLELYDNIYSKQHPSKNVINQ